MTNKQKSWEDSFKTAWAEEAHRLLDECGFEKTNQKNPEVPSTTKRSEALALQASLFVFAIRFLTSKKKELKERIKKEVPHFSDADAIKANERMRNHPMAQFRGIPDEKVMRAADKAYNYCREEILSIINEVL